MLDFSCFLRICPLPLDHKSLANMKDIVRSFTSIVLLLVNPSAGTNAPGRVSMLLLRHQAFRGREVHWLSSEALLAGVVEMFPKRFLDKMSYIQRVRAMHDAGRALVSAFDRIETLGRKMEWVGYIA